MKKITSYFFIFVLSLGFYCLADTEFRRNTSTGEMELVETGSTSSTDSSPRMYGTGTDAQEYSNLLGTKKKVKTYITEDGLAGEDDSGCTLAPGSKAGQNARYVCEVDSDGFIKILKTLYKLIFFVSLIIAVLVMVTIGILMSVSGVFEDAESMRGEMKKRMIEIIIGIGALALIPWILRTVAPFFFS